MLAIPQIDHFRFFLVAHPPHQILATPLRTGLPPWFTKTWHVRALWPIWCGRYRRVADIDVAYGRYGVLCGRYGCGRCRLWPISSFPKRLMSFYHFLQRFVNRRVTEHMNTCNHVKLPCETTCETTLATSLHRCCFCCQCHRRSILRISCHKHNTIK